MMAPEGELGAAAAVEHVFRAMGATYGAAWDRSLGAAPIGDVKTVWGDVLSDFLGSNEAKKKIVWGLKNLPLTVPNALQFRALCRQAPSAATPLLELPKTNMDIANRVFEAWREPSRAEVGRLDWARAILRDVQAGVRRSSEPVAMAKRALREGA